MTKTEHGIAVINEDVLVADIGDGYDAVLCDPPYGLKFMGKSWDHGVPSVHVWQRMLMALKPGAHVLAFGGTRTWHRLAVNIEDAGFEIRDTLMWLHGMGFPKSHNVGIATGSDVWKGYGTALKPAWEPIILARKPIEGTIADNCTKHGCGALDIEATRIPFANHDDSNYRKPSQNNANRVVNKNKSKMIVNGEHSHLGRFPSNLILDELAASQLNDQAGYSVSRGGEIYGSGQKRLDTFKTGERVSQIPADAGGVSRYFYCAKAMPRERDAGIVTGGQQRDLARNANQPSMNDGDSNPYNRGATLILNYHPTVKPIDLCKYMAQIILPPKRDTPRRLLVPFSGSGSEMIGAMLAGWDEITGVEMQPDYVGLARQRIDWWRQRMAQVGPYVEKIMDFVPQKENERQITLPLE